MTKNCKTAPKSAGLSPAVKTSLASLITLGAAQTGLSQIVMSTTIPSEGGLRLPTSEDEYFWDVDEDGTADFRMAYSTGSVVFADENGGRVFGTINDLDDPFKKISFGQAVGSEVTGYGFAANRQTAALTYRLDIEADAIAGGWSLGDTGYIGFKFTSGASTHFGWAEITIDGLGYGQGYIINEAWYNATPGASITAGQVSAVPEPSTYAAGLGALALGVAGLRRWRSRKHATGA